MAESDVSGQTTGSGPGFNVVNLDFVLAEGAFRTCSAELQRVMRTLEGEILGTLLNRSHYNGNQAGAFGRTYNAIRDEMVMANRELDKMSELVSQGLRSYAKGDEQATESLGHVAAQLPHSGGTITNALGR